MLLSALFVVILWILELFFLKGSIFSIFLYILLGGMIGFILFLNFDLLRERESMKDFIFLFDRKYRNITENADEAIMVYDREGRVVEWNRSAEKLFGLKKQEVIGREYPFEIERDRFMERMDWLERWGSFKNEIVKRKRKDGAVVTLRMSTIPFFNREREFIGFAEIAMDITEVMEAKQAMQDMERMAIFSEIAPGLAHQLNTPLASIQLMAQMLHEEVENPEIREDLLNIEKQVAYCKSIVDKLMRLSRRPRTKKTSVSFCKVVGELINFYSKELTRKNIRINYSFGPPESCRDCSIKADPEELSHVFLNLFSNSIDAMPNGGEIEITCRKVRDWLSVTFRDTGVGIPPENIPKIFDPFFTTKESGKGTGLGLSLVKRIVEEYGGDIKVRSRVGEGTEFVIRFPLNSRAEEVSESE